MLGGKGDGYRFIGAGVIFDTVPPGFLIDFEALFVIDLENIGFEVAKRLHGVGFYPRFIEGQTFLFLRRFASQLLLRNLPSS